MTPAADIPSHPPLDPSEKVLYDLNTVGYTILRSHVPPELLQRLLDSSRKLTTAARAAQWPYLRTCPKQFPPWPSQSGDEGIWGVQHLLHPDLYSENTFSTPNTITAPPLLTKYEASAFAELYFGEILLSPIRTILSLPLTGDLTMELLNLLVSPPSHFSLRWHRDSIAFSLSPTDEAAALGLIQASHTTQHGSAHGHGHNDFAVTEQNYYLLHPAMTKYNHMQYNVPLVADSTFHVVPGSHLRPRTEEELRVLEKDERSDELPGAVALELELGDVVFYNHNLIHRGVYQGIDEGRKERYTLHGSVSDANAGSERARNVLQHGVGTWVERCDFGGLLDGVGGENGALLRQRAEDMRRRLVELGSGTVEEDVGYHHAD